MSTRMCTDRGCDEPAVAWVRFRALDIERDCVRPYDDEADLCVEHLAVLEHGVELDEVFVYEQIEYTQHGFSFHGETLSV